MIRLRALSGEEREITVLMKSTILLNYFIRRWDKNQHISITYNIPNVLYVTRVCPKETSVVGV